MRISCVSPSSLFNLTDQLKMCISVLLISVCQNLAKEGKKTLKLSLSRQKKWRKICQKKSPLQFCSTTSFKQFLSLSDCMQKELYFAKKNKIYVPSNFMSFPHPTSVHSQGKKLCKVPFFKRCAMGF